MPTPAVLRRWFAVLFLVLLAVPAAAQNFPKQTGWVTDEAGLLQPADAQALTAQLYQLKQQTGRQLVVATVKSLDGQDIDTYAPLLFRQWKLGTSAADDGVLLLVAPNERRVRITTGYGAGGFLTDLVAGRIIRDDITPRFKAGDYPGGIKAGVTAIAGFMALSPEEQQRRSAELAREQQQARSTGNAINLAPFIVWGMIILFVLLSFARRGGGRRYRGNGISPWVVLWGLDALSRGSRGGGSWGGGDWGGGGGGFGGGSDFGGWGGGGGSTGGGGASGSW